MNVPDHYFPASWTPADRLFAVGLGVSAFQRLKDDQHQGLILKAVQKQAKPEPKTEPKEAE